MNQRQFDADAEFQRFAAHFAVALFIFLLVACYLVSPR